MSFTTKYDNHLQKYIPVEFVGYISQLLITYTVTFKIVKPRKTKLGDFRSNSNGKPKITVNGDLNPYAFLITTVHEFAHLIIHEKYGHSVKAHGIEWKSCFRELLLPIINSRQLPEDIEHALQKSINNVKASSCSDPNLYRVLLKYNQHNDNTCVLESLDKNSTFELNGRTYVKGTLRRTRFICTETNTKKRYLVNALTQVRELKNGK